MDGAVVGRYEHEEVVVAERDRLDLRGLGAAAHFLQPLPRPRVPQADKRAPLRRGREARTIEIECEAAER